MADAPLDSFELPAEGMANAFDAGIKICSATETRGSYIDQYRLIEILGEGGFGIVWRAEETGALKREVALKILKAGMGSKEVTRRFEKERQALALMTHSNIARIFNAGTTEAGRLYFAMELVKGDPITSYCWEHHLTTKEVIELFLPICDAIQHAHEKAIIHRDIKPSNILVREIGGHTQAMVIDFGIVKALGPQMTDAEDVHTFAGMALGTPQYMSPEQAGIVNLEIDGRSDVYSLGAVLYELLTGSPPLQREALQKMNSQEFQIWLAEQPIESPSIRLETAVKRTDGKPAKQDQKDLKLELKSGLDWIVLKALEKDRRRRYASAKALADDLRAYLDGKPTSAGPPSKIYRARKWFVKHRTGMAFTLTIFLAIVATGAVWWAKQNPAEVLQEPQPPNAPPKVSFAAANLTSAAEYAVTIDQMLKAESQRKESGTPKVDLLPELSKAFHLCKELRSRFPDPSSWRDSYMNVALENAYVLCDCKKLDEAQPLYDEGITLFKQWCAEKPTDANRWVKLGNAQMAWVGCLWRGANASAGEQRQSVSKDALDTVAKIRELDPESAAACYIGGAAISKLTEDGLKSGTDKQYLLERLEVQMAATRRLVAKSPDNPEATSALAGQYLLKNKILEAQQLVSEALAAQHEACVKINDAAVVATRIQSEKQAYYTWEAAKRWFDYSWKVYGAERTATLNDALTLAKQSKSHALGKTGSFDRWRWAAILTTSAEILLDRGDLFEATKLLEDAWKALPQTQEDSKYDGIILKDKANTARLLAQALFNDTSPDGQRIKGLLDFAATALQAAAHAKRDPQKIEEHAAKLDALRKAVETRFGVK